MYIYFVYILLLLITNFNDRLFELFERSLFYRLRSSRLLSKRTKLTDFPRDNHAGNST